MAEPNKLNAASDAVLGPPLTCSTCGTVRPSLDMAHVWRGLVRQDVCHPAMSEGLTCYMKALGSHGQEA